jgi:2-polyprenyl-3-methyl-5-hydroxy-6-metoxy-1,4-benzoquinol methylase
VLEAVPISTDASILDLACGSGEITGLLVKHGYTATNITGMDPYTHKTYTANTGCKCLEYTFHDLISGQIQDLQFDCVVCSYAVHLIDKDGLYGFMSELASLTGHFVVLTHMRKFEVKHYMWRLDKELYFPHEKIKLMSLIRV